MQPNADQRLLIAGLGGATAGAAAAVISLSQITSTTDTVYPTPISGEKADSAGPERAGKRDVKRANNVKSSFTSTHSSSSQLVISNPINIVLTPTATRIRAITWQLGEKYIRVAHSGCVLMHHCT
jgi:hypothetical protein